MTAAVRSPWGWAFLVAVALGSLAPHLPGLANPLSIDDKPMLEEHPDVIRDDGIWRLWTRNYWGPLRPGGQRTVYRPIAILALHASVRVTGAAPVPERAINLALLGTLGVLVAAWVAGHAPPVVAAMAASLVVLHPSSATHVQQVVGRADLLAFIGTLGAALCARRAARRGGWTATGLAGLVGSCAVAMGAKETGLLALPAFAVAAYLEADRARRGRVLAFGIAAVAPVLAALLVGRWYALGGTLVASSAVFDMGPQANPLEPLAFAERAPGALAVAARYAQLLVWPDTSFNHHPDVAPAWGLEAGAGAVAVALLGVILVRALVRCSQGAVPAGLALGNYLVVGSLLIRAGVFAANRLMLPFVAAAATALALAIAPSWATRRVRVAAVLVWVAVAVGYGVVTAKSYERWRSAVDVFAYDHDRRPGDYGPLALYGIALSVEGRKSVAEMERAVELLRRAIELRPDHPQAMIPLGESLVRLGRTDEARAVFERVLASSDPHPVVRFHQMLARVNLAALAIDAGKLDLAALHLARAADVDPHHPSVLHNRAALEFARDDFPALVATLVELARDAPRYEPARGMRDKVVRELRSRAARHAEVDGFGAARAALELALRLEPDDAPTLFELADTQRELGAYREAIATYDRVLALRPNHAVTLVNRGYARLELGDAAAALADFDEAIAIEPKLRGRLQANLDRARRLLER